VDNEGHSVLGRARPFRTKSTATKRNDRGETSGICSAEQAQGSNTRNLSCHDRRPKRSEAKGAPTETVTEVVQRHGGGDVDEERISAAVGPNV
jgi:hypothetical protein